MSPSSHRRCRTAVVASLRGAMSECDHRTGRIWTLRREAKQRQRCDNGDATTATFTTTRRRRYETDRRLHSVQTDVEIVLVEHVYIAPGGLHSGSGAFLDSGQGVQKGTGFGYLIFQTNLNIV